VFLGELGVPHPVADDGGIAEELFQLGEAFTRSLEGGPGT